MTTRQKGPGGVSSLKVLIVTGIFPPDTGGPATYVPRIADALAGLGHRVEVITLADVSSAERVSQSYSVTRIRRSLWIPFRMLKTILTIARRASSADVVLANGLACESAIAVVVARRPLVLKVVGDFAWERARNWGRCNVTIDDFQEEPHDLVIEAVRALRSWWTRRANAVIVPSEYLRRIVKGWGVNDSAIYVVYNAADLPSESAPERLGNSQLVYVGRLVPWKRVDRLLYALGEVPQATLVIVGDGDEEPALRHLADQLRVADRAIFVGAQPKHRVASLIAGSDALVLCSEYEGLSHVLLEAMALGVPAIASEVGGNVELVTDMETGLLVGERRSLVEAIQLVLTNPRLSVDLGRRAATKVRKQFDVDHMVGATERILREAVRSKCRGTSHIAEDAR